jgi:RNase P protein component
MPTRNRVRRRCTFATARHVCVGVPGHDVFVVDYR